MGSRDPDRPRHGRRQADLQYASCNRNRTATGPEVFSPLRSLQRPAQPVETEARAKRVRWMVRGRGGACSRDTARIDMARSPSRFLSKPVRELVPSLVDATSFCREERRRLRRCIRGTGHRQRLGRRLHQALTIGIPGRFRRLAGCGVQQPDETSPRSAHARPGNAAEVEHREGVAGHSSSDACRLRAHFVDRCRVR